MLGILSSVPVALALCPSIEAPPVVLDPEGTAASWNAAIPDREVLTVGRSRYLHYPETGQMHLLQPGMTREFNTAFSEVQGAETVRGPFALFLFNEDFPQEWYNGAHPTRADLGLGEPRHPAYSREVTIPPQAADLDIDMTALLESVETRVPRSRLSAYNGALLAGAAYARDYHNAVLAGTVGPDELEMAERAVRILARFSEVAWQWPTTGGADVRPFWLDRFNGNPATEHVCRGNQCQPLFWVDRANQVESNLDTPPLWLPFMYTLVYNADEAWDVVQEEQGCIDLRKKVERDLFQVMLTTHLLGNKITPFGGNYNNRFAGVTELLSQWAYFLDDPLMYHFAVRLLADFVYQGFYLDGVWNEVGYAQYTINGLYRNEFTSFRPYTDPPGYVDPYDGRTFTGLGPEDPEILRLRAQVAQNAVAEHTLQLPDGFLLSINDAGWKKYPRPQWRSEPGTPFEGLESTADRERSASGHLTGLGHTVLGGGEGDAQYQLHLEMSLDEPAHNDDDYLTFVLYDERVEILAENTYANDTPFYAFKRTAQDHNHAVPVGPVTPIELSDWPEHHAFSGPRRSADPLYLTGQVLVPGLRVDRSWNRTEDGEVVGVPMAQTLFVPDGPVQATEGFHPAVDSAGHRRTLLSVVLPGDVESDRYTLDVYETYGHGEFELLYAGPGQHDYRFDVDGLVLSDGTEPSPWDGVRSEWSGAANGTGTRHVGTSAAGGDSLDWALQLPEEGHYGLAPGAYWVPERLVAHTASGGALDAHLGLVPNARLIEGTYASYTLGETGRERRKEQLALRRRSDASGTTRWVTALEVVGEASESRVVHVEDLTAPASGEGDAVLDTGAAADTGSDGTATAPLVPARVLRVTLTSGETDLVFLGHDERASVSVDGVDFEGRLGWLRRDADGQIVDAYLHDGTLLDWGADRIELPAAPTGSVKGIARTDLGEDRNGFELAGTVAEDGPRQDWLAVEFGDGHIKWFPADGMEAAESVAFLPTAMIPLFRLVSGLDTALEAEVEYVKYDAYPGLSPLGGLSWRQPLNRRLGDPEPELEPDTGMPADSADPYRADSGGADREETSPATGGAGEVSAGGCGCAAGRSTPVGGMGIVALFVAAWRRRRPRS